MARAARESILSEVDVEEGCPSARSSMPSTRALRDVGHDVLDLAEAQQLSAMCNISTSSEREGREVRRMPRSAARARSVRAVG